MIKKAVVYDKWLSTLGGGEVVACNFAKALIDNNYELTFVCGKKVDPKIIKDKLGIDLSKAIFLEIWNDEKKLQEITKNKDIFINASYMDYMSGNASKNFYYTSFPTESYNNIKGFILNNFIYPKIVKYIKPIEFIEQPKSITSQSNHLLYQLDKNLKIAFSFLQLNKTYKLKFSLFLESFNKKNLEQITWKIDTNKIKNSLVKIDHNHNIVKVEIDFIPQNQTTNLEFININNINNIFLINPKILTNNIVQFITKSFYEKINSRLRAGIFSNISQRMKSFDLVFANSGYTSYWIKKYWNVNSQVLYPPVEMLFRKYNLEKNKKENKICSVGRFFTLGHSKKQEIMIEAFKKMYDSGIKNWELHLAGGLGNEPTSIKFMGELQKAAKNYPVFFHINCSRKEIEELYLSSKIYWHAAGFGENKKKNPIKFEHFGITPIEAMSLGCIPVLYNGGGLPETVKTILPNEFNLHIYNSIDELVLKTKNIIKERSSNSVFTTEKFLKNLEKHYSQETFKNTFLDKIN